ncbi:MAG TPA: pilin [Candidatus Saccharimonadales bacterium]|nr:pilin [Candidatus Saccharimonadales bacterium]
MRRLSLLLTGALLYSPIGALAADANSELCKGVGEGFTYDPGTKTCSKQGVTQLAGTGNSLFHQVANLLVFLAGAIAVLILIIGGIRYVTSTGDASRIKQAKDTILYAIVGLVVVLLAYAIVNFILGNIK